MNTEILFQLIPVSMGLTITLVAFLVTYIMVPQAMYLADRFGIVDIPDKRRIHRQVVPRAGGIALYAGVLTACFFIILLSPLISDKTIDLSWICGMFFGSSLVFLTGLIDDLIGIKALGKLSGQIAAIIIVYFCGIRLQILSGYSLPLILDFFLTIFWFLLIINAFNLIDGIDGLAVGIAGISALGIAGFLIQRKLPLEACILFAILGGAIGFLKYNRHPASIFLGDSGSNFLGFFMAAMMIATGSKSTTIGYLWAPLLAVIIPAVDLSLAVWRRTAAWLLEKLEGKNSNLRIMTGDLEHLHHRLLRFNMHPRDAAATLCLVNALFVLGGLMAFPYQYQGWGILLVCSISCCFLAWRYILGAEIDKSLRVIKNIIVTPQKPILAMFVYAITDAITILFSLLVSIRITHPDFPIPAVFERADLIFAFWMPLGILTIILIEFNIFSKNSSIFTNRVILGFTTLSIVSAALGFIYLSEIVNTMRAVSNIVIYISMNFLLLVFSRFLLSVLDVDTENLPETTSVPEGAARVQRLNNLRFYGRLPD